MFLNTRGVNGRGPSNSIASPGVSAIFGGASVPQSRPETAPVRSSVPSNGNTQDTVSLNRYTPTYKSSAFAHTEYQPPLRTTDSAADRILRSTGTAIEDYGRRDVLPKREELYSSSPLAKRAAEEAWAKWAYGDELRKQIEEANQRDKQRKLEQRQAGVNEWTTTL